VGTEHHPGNLDRIEFANNKQLGWQVTITEIEKTIFGKVVKLLQYTIDQKESFG
jgi:hypothetical protein